VKLALVVLCLNIRRYRGEGEMRGWEKLALPLLAFVSPRSEGIRTSSSRFLRLGSDRLIVVKIGRLTKGFSGYVRGSRECHDLCTDESSMSLRSWSETYAV
jgi:hypothetical protein